MNTDHRGFALDKSRLRSGEKAALSGSNAAYVCVYLPRFPVMFCLIRLTFVNHMMDFVVLSFLVVASSFLKRVGLTELCGFKGSLGLLEVACRAGKLRRSDA